MTNTALRVYRSEQLWQFAWLMLASIVVMAGGPLAGVVTQITNLAGDYQAIGLIVVAGGALVGWMIHLALEHNWRALFSLVAFLLVIGGILLIALTIFGGGGGGALVG